MKKILSLFLCICMAFASLTSVAFAASTVEVELTSDRYGHIYTEAGQNFNISVKNTSSTNLSGKIKYEILSGGTAIYSAEKEVTIDAGATYIDEPVLPLSKYGIFDLKASVMQGSTVLGTDTLPFSFINGSKNGEGSLRMFVNSHIEANDNNKEEVAAIRDAGFGGLRMPVYWFTVETYNKNEYRLPSHIPHIKEAAKMGMEPLVILSGGNGPWGVINEAENNLNMAPDTDEERKAFANYCTYVAQNLKGYVKYYEIWNEFTQGSNGGDQTPANYANLLIAASEAIKAADPDAKIVAMCTASIDTTFISGVISALNSKGKANCYDIVSVHPYTYGTSHALPTTKISALKSIVNKPIWFTERGWDTSTNVSNSTNGISDAAQAIYGVWDYLTMVSKNYCDRWFWYDFQDDGNDPAYAENNFGLIESRTGTIPGFAKQAYIAFAALNKLVGRSEFVSVSSSGNAKAYCFEDENGEETFALTGNVGNTITITSSAPTLELLDKFSNVVSVYNNTSGSYKVTLTDQVMYVRRHYEPAGCTVAVSGEKLLITGHSMESDQEVGIMVTAADGELVYVGQVTCDDNRAFSVTADRKGINELYVRVNYGALHVDDVETGIVLKLMCDGERIFSVDDITTNKNLNLVVSVNDALTTAVNVYVASYDNEQLQTCNTITLDAGTAEGDYDLEVKLNDNYDKISGFVWENLVPASAKVEFN